MRDAPNYDDANFALRLYELRREPEMRKARAMVGDLLAGAPWETVQALRQYEHPENAHFRQVTSYWEIVASFVNRGIFHPDVYLDTCSEGLFTWWALKPHVARIRAEGTPRFLMQTERLVTENPACAERVEAIEKAMAAVLEKEKAAKASSPAKAPKISKPAKSAPKPPAKQARP